MSHPPFGRLLGVMSDTNSTENTPDPDLFDPEKTPVGTDGAAGSAPVSGNQESDDPLEKDDGKEH